MITKIAASRDRLYALDAANKLWFRGRHGWEHVWGPTDNTGDPLTLVGVTYGTVYDNQSDGVVEYLYVLTRGGRLFLQDYAVLAGWREMDGPK